MQPRLTDRLVRLGLASSFALAVTIGLDQTAIDRPDPKGQVLAQVSGFLPETINPQTTSRFSYQEYQENKIVPFQTRVVPDPELEWGVEETIQEGRNGQVVSTIQISYYDGKEIGRDVTRVERQEAIEQIIAQGTKIVIREVDTPDGKIRYKGRFWVWATSYDGNCPGCRDLTYSGTPVRHGTIAVDPNLIPLGSNLYVPGYGFGRAEDIGGSIKGKRVDLGFENLAHGSWSARWVNVYVLE